MKVSSVFNFEDDGFNQYIIVSLLLHSSFLILMVAKNILSPSTVLEIPPSVRVDMVALPDKLPDNPTFTEQKPEPKAASKPLTPDKPKNKTDLNKVKDDQKKALDKLKAMESIDKIKNEIKAQSQKEIPAEENHKFKGNVISSGNSFTGMSRLRVNEYLENLTSKVRDNWLLPQWLSNANLKAAVIISIDSRGYITRREVHVSSGNSIFDSSCLAAVTNAAPFEPPPDEVKEASILIRFPFE